MTIVLSISKLTSQSDPISELVRLSIGGGVGALIGGGFFERRFALRVHIPVQERTFFGFLLACWSGEVRGLIGTENDWCRISEENSSFDLGEADEIVSSSKRCLLLRGKSGISEEVVFKLATDAEAERGLFSGRTSSEELLPS